MGKARDVPNFQMQFGWQFGKAFENREFDSRGVVVFVSSS